jgi:hypothetical protein
VSAVEIRNVWHRRDPDLERDVELFWRSNKALPPGADVGTRLSELTAVAYLDNRIVGVSTASIRPIDFLRCKLAMFRVLVAPEARIRKVASDLTLFTRNLLETWSRENPDQEVMGMGAVIQSRALVENDRNAIYPDSKLVFIGYTQEGFQMRVYWFAHATVSKYWPGGDSQAPAGKEQPS